MLIYKSNRKSNRFCIKDESQKLADSGMFPFIFYHNFSYSRMKLLLTNELEVVTCFDHTLPRKTRPLPV